MMKRYAILADDLTGAGDTGAQFAAAGLNTRALLGEWTHQDAEGAEVLVVNTDSRPLPPERAAERVRFAAKTLVAAGITPFFKKVDSTLRGPIGVEIDALMDEVGLSCALVCPAFPANGRTIVGGYLLVEGQPVSRGAAGRDPVTPVRESHIPSLLSTQSRRTVLGCSISQIEAGQLPGLIQQAKAAGALLVCDAVSDADLEVVACAALASPQGLLLVGAAGLAAPVASLLVKAAGRKSPDRHPVLVLVGSVNPVAREQAKRLSFTGVRVITLSPEDMLGEDSHERLKNAALGVAAAAVAGETILVTTAGESDDVMQARALGNQLGLDSAGTASAIAATLARMARAAVEANPDIRLVATGGDVARAIMGTFESGALDVLGEVSPGIPVCALRGGIAPGLQIITKAGGFGKPEAIQQAVALLSKQGCVHGHTF